MDRRFNWRTLHWRSLLQSSAIRSFSRTAPARTSDLSASAYALTSTTPPAPAADIRARLSATLPKFERLCVTGGEKLETLCNGSTQLVADCSALLEIASGRLNGQSLARATLDLLAGPLGYLDFCRDRHTELLQRLSACEDRTRSMIEVRARMHTTLAPLTYMTVLFKIESATLSEEFRETFATVTTEIDRMRQLVDETFTKNAELLANAHTTLARVRESLEKDFRSRFAHIAARRRQIDDTIRLLDDQLAQNTERDSVLRRQSQTIATEVSQIVQALQFQDIVQQKSDHVLSALDAWKNESPTQPLARLQALQLEAVATDIADGHQTVSTGLSRIRASIERFDENTRQLDTLADIASPDGMVKRLLDSIAEVHAMIHGLADTTAQTHEAIRPAGDLASSLSSTLVELATNMRLIALNAQIRSVQIGDLTGLETLASRTASISAEIDGVSEESSHALAALRVDLDAMFATFEEFRRLGSEQIIALDADRPAAESRLHTLRERATTSQESIAVSIESLQSCAREFDTTLAGLPPLRTEITAAASALHTLSETFPASSASDLSTHTARYTMASEHATAAALLGTATVASASASTGTTDATPELFDAAPSASASVPTPTTASSNIELF
ncbi:hypothetical protein CMV30_02865 [Nibricoccus aquaticus]|uniref:Methyl-accepting transducer domain-containing protein n=1 Tax=Nibricoccus aquaticus TaxID=2576891 RepID=A0A290Q2U8_9BACT|nr:hypothetical protein [Nibricoccus aquaticus]ATC62989.1 hypothetical protein CMV30_02865 [Nibricoccus aquaticus]